jgi:hypothetical protein
LEILLIVEFLIPFPMLNVVKFAIINIVLAHTLNWDSIVGIATCHRLVGTWIESW